MAIEIRDNIQYGRAGNRPLEAVLYRPKEAADPLPIIVWVHGGAWLGGNQYDDRAIHKQIAANGFACLSISYRLSQEAIFPAQIQDCKGAIRYIRANADSLGVSAEKIGIWGPSAGGHLAALLGTSVNMPELEGDSGFADQSSAVQAVCDWFGPTDFTQMSAHPSRIDHNAANSPESLLIGGAIQDNRDKVRKASPITYISESTPPFFIAHGTADPLVPFNQSELLYDALVAQGIEVTFERMQGAGHGGPGFEAKSPLVERCIAFFKQRLMS